jgi:hypothetical protein
MLLMIDGDASCIPSPCVATTRWRTLSVYSPQLVPGRPLQRFKFPRTRRTRSGFVELSMVQPRAAQWLGGDHERVVRVIGKTNPQSPQGHMKTTRSRLTSAAFRHGKRFKTSLMPRRLQGIVLVGDPVTRGNVAAGMKRSRWYRSALSISLKLRRKEFTLFGIKSLMPAVFATCDVGMTFKACGPGAGRTAA